jgi:hypothetical protein
LEQVLSIRELHLVKHTYNDLFFLHRKNDKAKAIRAIVRVPVVVTAHLNLKEIQLVKSGDSIKQIILPRAIVNEPQYHVEKMVLRETRTFPLYAGSDITVVFRDKANRDTVEALIKEEPAISTSLRTHGWKTFHLGSYPCHSKKTIQGSTV